MISGGEFVAVVLGLIVMGCLGRAWQVWNDRAPRFRHLPAAVLRAVPAFAVCLAPLFIFATWLVSMPDDQARSASPSLTLAVYGSLGTLLVGVVLTAATAIWGRPRALVPPHLRVPREGENNDRRPDRRACALPSRAPGPRLSPSLPGNPGPATVTYRHRYFVVGHIVTAAVALPVFILVFRALLENDWWVQVGIYLVAVGGAVWFYLEGRRGIRVSPDGVTVIETSRKIDASWREVKTFVLFGGENGDSPQAYVRLASGEMLRLTGVDGGDFGRWDSASVERLVAVLNRRLHEARVKDRTGLRERSQSSS